MSPDKHKRSWTRFEVTVAQLGQREEGVYMSFVEFCCAYIPKNTSPDGK